MYIVLYSSSTPQFDPNSLDLQTLEVQKRVQILSESSLSSQGPPLPSGAQGPQPPLSEQIVPQQQESFLQSQSQSQSSNSNSNSNANEDAGSKVNANANVNNINEAAASVKTSDGVVVWDGDDSALGEGIAADLVSPAQPEKILPSVEMLNETKLTASSGSEYVKLFPCDDFAPQRSSYAQRGAYWVLYNYVRGEKTFHCDQSITYTTHADFSFLDNVVPLLERWQGPLSLSIYAPGTDFVESMNRILYLRECASPLVRDLVTFHIFFDSKHVPKSKIPVDPFQHFGSSVNCSAPPPTFGEGLTTYKKIKKLSYPVNVARNIAREMAQTHYVLPSDIELYPNPNLIQDFLDMVKNNDTLMQRPNPKVFVISIFEVEANVPALPYDKRDLIKMLGEKTAIPFHKYVCADCHRIPKAQEWLREPFTPGMRVFHVGKRYKPYHHWEPIYIGTKDDPEYDERLSWEGRSDKMTQGYVLCVMDYEFMILDNAFLVHRPGIKRIKIIPKKNPVVAKQNTFIARTVLPELKLIYGTRPGCVV
jgi:hypothetical protein